MGSSSYWESMGIDKVSLWFFGISDFLAVEYDADGNSLNDATADPAPPTDGALAGSQYFSVFQGFNLGLFCFNSLFT